MEHEQERIWTGASTSTRRQNTNKNERKEYRNRNRSEIERQMAEQKQELIPGKETGARTKQKV